MNHDLFNEAQITKESALELLMSDDFSLHIIIGTAPRKVTEALLFYRSEYEAVVESARLDIIAVRKMRDNGFRREEIGAYFRGQKSASWGLLGLDSDDDPIKIINADSKRLLQQMRDYKPREN